MIVNEVDHDVASGVNSNRFQHTDALGSPVAETNGSRTVLSRAEYEPYGQVLSGGIADRPGFTGHVADAQTGLDYMQQRYYDPLIGRFLSVDPVMAYSNPVGAFNRYWYGNDNPYKFTDPDGRQVEPEADPIEVETAREEIKEFLNPTGPLLVPVEPNEQYCPPADPIRIEMPKSPLDEPAPSGNPFEAYNRRAHYGNTPTAADRKALGAGEDEVVDHVPPLVQRFYEGDPARGGKPESEMSPAERRESAQDRSRMRTQPRRDSNKQGGEMSQYSKRMKKEKSR